MRRSSVAVFVVALAACSQPVSEAGADGGTSASSTMAGTSSGSSSGVGGTSGGTSSGSSGTSGSSGGSSGSSGGHTLTGTVTRIAGNGDVYPDGGACTINCYVDGPGDQAMFQQVSGLAVIGRTLYVADTLNEVIRAVDLRSAPIYTVSTLAGNPSLPTTQDGTRASAGFYLPLQPFAYNGTLLVGTGMNVRQVTVPGGVVTTFAGPNSGNKASENISYPVSFAGAFFNDVAGLTVDGSTGLIYTTDFGSGYIHELDPFTKQDYYFAGAGKAVTFQYPTSVVALNGGLFISDTGNNTIRLASLPDAGTPLVKDITVYGTAGFADSSSPNGPMFNGPTGMCTDGQTLYIVDQGNQAVRAMDPVTYNVTTLIGGPDAGLFHSPYDCVWDPMAGVMFVSDQAIAPDFPDGIGNVIYMVQ